MDAEKQWKSQGENEKCTLNGVKCLKIVG